MFTTKRINLKVATMYVNSTAVRATLSSALRKNKSAAEIVGDAMSMSACSILSAITLKKASKQDQHKLGEES